VGVASGHDYPDNRGQNRSHNPKTTNIKLQSFFFDQTGRFFGWQQG
jgi:hypothetical protein